MSELEALFSSLNLSTPPKGDALPVENPSTGEIIWTLPMVGPDDADASVAAACESFVALRKMPAPARGELVRLMGERLREHKDSLAKIVGLESGKGFQEARGEVQEMIDICEFAVGLSRTVGGRTMDSERPGHRMFEQWHPLGPVLCISAFNFPVAVWSWNAALGFICGDPIIWKPSLKTPLSAIAVHGLLQPVLANHDPALASAMELVIGPDDTVASRLVDDPRIPLVSATGSCRMGRIVAPRVAARLGRSLLELGGNNAIIVDKTADLDLAARGIAFGAAGTAGQRCTTTRRLFVERSVLEPLLAKVVAGYKGLLGRIGDALDPETMVGPLVDADAKQGFVDMVAKAKSLGGEVLVGGEVVDRAGHFVQPTVIRAPDAGEFEPMMQETFAPILYVRAYDEGDLAGAIAQQNSVEQGLSSSLFTDSVGAMERFLSVEGSDCGIANINIGTSGAEIGGAFGGEKATGGGREAGSDSWKAYMRRQTCTVNGSGALPLAQGIKWE